MGNILNRRREMGGKSLPYDAELQWVSGGVYEFDFPMSVDTRHTWSYKRNRSSFWQYYAWNYPVVSNKNFIFGGTGNNNGRNTIIYRTGTGHVVGILSENTIFNCEADFTTDNKIYKVDNSIITTFTDSNIFSPDSNQKFRISLYSEVFTFYWHKVHNKLGELIYDIIPVRIGQDVYLYDRINKLLIARTGTDTYELGPDK